MYIFKVQKDLSLVDLRILEHSFEDSKNMFVLLFPFLLLIIQSHGQGMGNEISTLTFIKYIEMPSLWKIVILFQI